MTHPACLPIEILLDACSVKRTRGSGPGGQHRNKVETAIVITHEPTGVVGQASEKRSQNTNREVAIERLRVNLALAVRSKDCSDARPSQLWCSRVKSRKIQVNPKHADFPALLAEALDFTDSHGFDVAAAAESLNVSTSQLIKFFKACPASFELVNRKRETLGLNRLS
jgi:hypothetical protein